MGEAGGGLEGRLARWRVFLGKEWAGRFFVGDVFLAALGATLGLAWTHAPIVPYLDDCGHAVFVAGEEPITAAWLWAPHNEHRIPLPKLLSQGLARLSGMDGRPESAGNVLLLAGAAWMLLRALRRFRGRVLWTDACIPLILLSWAQWENLAWPFQIAFALYAFLVSAGLALLLRRPGDPPGRARPTAFAAILLALPLCGAPGLPLALALGAAWVVADRDDGRRMWARYGPPAAAFGLVLLYFVGLERPVDSPPPPALGHFASVTVQALAGPLGHVAHATWPVSGIVVLALLAMAAACLIEAGWKRPAGRGPALAFLAVLGGVVLLAGSIGYGRGGGWYETGFTSRYATLTALAFVVVYVAADFDVDPRIARVLRTGLLTLTAAVALPNGLRALAELAPRREAADRMIQDIRRGVPLPVLTERYVARWHHKQDPTFDRAMETLARHRLAVFRKIPPPPRTILDDGFAGGAAVAQIPDGRFALRMPPEPVKLTLPGGRVEVRLTVGTWAPESVEVVLSAHLGGSSGPPSLVRTESLRVPRGEERTVSFTVEDAAGVPLLLRAGPRDKVWLIPEVRAATSP